MFLFSEFYENYAVMMEEEGTVIVGLLVGLNVIDANLCVKGEDLDSQVGVIDFSIYLKSDEDNHDREGRNVHISAILDQKNYVEELNRQLNKSIPFKFTARTRYRHITYSGSKTKYNAYL
ncbi:hypothetical protein AB205_0163790 [Aquarana catesbeiana]|uniref:RUN domain-containing protein n=1 Tax=Aquarana catesbeiana TaxID=8400 RepID=A0A2G9SF12_AQUCT|nr:hypothetical protein AB205_0163790 [Aquarana catesbeiana]